MKKILSIVLLSISLHSFSQAKWNEDSLKAYQLKYVKDHEVVKGEDKKFISFFPASKDYAVIAKLTKTPDSKWFTMETSGSIKQMYRVYGTAQFKIHDTLLQLNIYQSKSLLGNAEYKDYLFLPFTDLSSGDETYGGGRYIDLLLSDIKGDKISIDFNKCYNPYCAYEHGYSCPIPPKENDLNFYMKAGEKNYGKKNH